jgi:hypothetical protein
MKQTISQSPLDFSAHIAERTQHFTGREWVFQAIDDWLADLSSTRIFLLTGGREPERAPWLRGWRS